MRCSSKAFSLHICGHNKGAFCSGSFSTDPVGYAIIFLDVYDFALMSAVDEAPVLSDHGTSLELARRVIGHCVRRIRLGLAVSIDDNPRERSRPAYLTHYKSGIVRERDAGGYGD